jgi:hypothetical protein
MIHASANLKNEKTFVMKFIKKNPEIFKYLSNSLQSDKEIVWLSFSRNVVIKKINFFDLKFKFK